MKYYLYYNKEGSPVSYIETNRWNPRNYYLSVDGKLLQVPYLNDSEEDIFNYTLACVYEKYPDITKEKYQKFWDHYKDMKLILIKNLSRIGDWHRRNGRDLEAISYDKLIHKIKNFNGPIVSGEQIEMLKWVTPYTSKLIEKIIKENDYPW